MLSKLPIAALKVAMLAVILALVGTSVGVSQEEDVCASVFDIEEDWSAQAYGYCRLYCVELDCAGEPATEEDAAQCVALLNNYEELTGGQVPSCEVP